MPLGLLNWGLSCIGEGRFVRNFSDAPLRYQEHLFKDPVKDHIKKNTTLLITIIQTPIEIKN